MTKNAIKQLYESAFLPDERRDFELLQALLAGNRKIALETSEHGFMIYWTFDCFRYIEHFAVSDEYRGNGIGSKMLKKFLAKSDLPVVLEVELPNNSIAVHRIMFYERIGFSLLSTTYTQPPYSPEKHSVAMHLMSNGSINVEDAVKTIRREVYGATI